MRNLDEKNLSEKLISASKRLTNLVSHETPHKLVKEIYEEMQIFGIDKVFDIYLDHLMFSGCNQKNLDAAFASVILMHEIGDNKTQHMASEYLVSDLFSGFIPEIQLLMPILNNTTRFYADAYDEALKMHSNYSIYRTKRYIYSLSGMAVRAWTTHGKGRLRGKKIEDVLLTSPIGDDDDCNKIYSITDEHELIDWIIFLSQHNFNMKIIINNLIELFGDEISSEEFPWLVKFIEDFKNHEENYLYGDPFIFFTDDDLKSAKEALKTFKKISKL